MLTTPRPVARRALAGLAGSVLAVATLGASPLTPAAAAAEPGVPVAPADAALEWLGGEIVANDGLLTITFGEDTFPDPGLTLDAVLALAAGGHATSPGVDSAAAALPGQMPDYITGFAGGTARAAGATAKTLLTELVLGRDLSPTFELEADLRSLLTAEGTNAGRFQDREGFGDFSNGLGQALAVLALDRTSEGVPAPAIDFLLAQQCDNGAFLLYYAEAGGSCTDASGSDPDATAFALMALAAVPSTEAVATAIDDAVAYLLGQQDASGGFLGTGAVNANTTGVAAAALRAVGQAGPADAGAGFLATLLLTDSCADLGALAYDPASFAGGLTDRSQWVRATAQGALGLGLPAYGGIGIDAPVPAGLAAVACPEAPGPVDPPVDPAAPSVTLGSTTVTAGGTISGSASGFEPGEDVVGTLFSTPRTLGTVVADATGRVDFSFVVPADVEPGVHRLELAGQRSGRTVSIEVEVLGVTVPGTLPATGAGSGELVVAAMALLVAGAALRRGGQRRAAAVTVPVGR